METLSYRECVKLCQERDFLKDRESQDRKNFQLFEAELNVNSSQNDRKSPFLRAIMRTHTKEMERIEKMRTELHLTKATTADMALNLRNTEVELVEKRNSDKDVYRHIAQMIGSKIQGFDKHMRRIIAHSNKTLTIIDTRINICESQIHKIAVLLYNTSLKIGEHNGERQKMGELISQLSLKIQDPKTGLSVVEKKLEALRMDHSTLTETLRVNEQRLKNEKRLLNVGIESEKERVLLAERLRMSVEDWHGVASNLKSACDNGTSYSRFLEEQLLSVHKRVASAKVSASRVGTSHTTRGSPGMEERRKDGEVSEDWVDSRTIQSLSMLQSPSTRNGSNGITLRVQEEYQMHEPPRTIEDKLMSLVNELEERMKVVDHVRLLSQEEQYHKYLDQMDEMRIAAQKTEDEKLFWSTVLVNLEDYKSFCLASFDAVKNNLARARFDIKQFHDAKNDMMKTVADWELKFLNEHGKHPSPADSEAGMGYIYEMLDKLQYDLRDKIASIVELSVKFRHLKQVLEDISTPLEISRDRSERGMSPVPREFPERYYLVEKVTPEVLERTLSAGQKSSSKLAYDDMEEYGKGILDEFELKSMMSVEENEEQAPSYETSEELSKGLGRKINQTDISEIEMVTERPATSMTADGSAKTDSHELVVEKEYWSKVYNHLEARKRAIEEPLILMKSNLRYSKDEINYMIKKRTDLRAQVEGINTPGNVEEDAKVKLQAVETTLKMKIEKVSNISAQMGMVKQEMRVIDVHIELARERSERGVSPIARPFTEKYLNLDKDPDSVVFEMGLIAGEMEAGDPSSSDLQGVDKKKKKKKKDDEKSDKLGSSSRSSLRKSRDASAPFPPMILEEEHEGSESAAAFVLLSKSTPDVKESDNTTMSTDDPQPVRKISTPTLRSYDLAQLEDVKEEAKRAIKRWRRSFMKNHNREPTLKEKKHLAKDLFAEYARIEVAITRFLEKQTEKGINEEPDPGVNEEKDRRRVMDIEEIGHWHEEEVGEEEEEKVVVGENVVNLEDGRIEEEDIGADPMAPTPFIDEEQVDNDRKPSPKVQLVVDEAEKRLEEIQTERTAAKQKVKIWTRNFQNEHGRDPTTDDKKSQVSDIFITFATLDNQLNIQKKIVKTLYQKMDEYKTVISSISGKTKEIDNCKIQILTLENRKKSAKTDIEDWNTEFRQLNNRDPTAKEKREHSTELYTAFTKTENELQGEKKRLKYLIEALEDMKTKASSMEEEMEYNQTKTPTHEGSSQVEESEGAQKMQNAPKFATPLSPDVPSSKSKAVPSPRPEIDPLGTKIRVTIQSIDEENAAIEKMREFLILSKDQLKELKSQRVAAKASIKRWVEVFKDTVGRMPTIEDQKSALEKHLFEKYQSLEESIETLKLQQVEAEKKISDSEKSVTRMQEVLRRMQQKAAEPSVPQNL